MVAGGEAGDVVIVLSGGGDVVAKEVVAVATLCSLVRNEFVE